MLAYRLTVQINELFNKKISLEGLFETSTIRKLANLETIIEEYILKGAIIISEPKPAILFNNKRVSFLYLSYGLVELVEQ